MKSEQIVKKNKLNSAHFEATSTLTEVKLRKIALLFFITRAKATLNNP